MYDHVRPSTSFHDFIELVAILRKECPWDRKQTHESIKENLIEEAYEAAEAIEDKNYEELSRELGDLLLHVLFQSKLASEHGAFSIDDVIFRIQEKLIRRHPHVFDRVEVKNEQHVAENWEKLKMKEGKKSVLDGLPKHLPALIRAYRMQEKVSNIGFDWPSEDGPWQKIEEELQELKDAVKQKNQEQIRLEFGDLLFSMVNLSRFVGVQPEDALRASNSKFERRFREVEKEVEKANKPLSAHTLDELDQLWEKAKLKEGFHD